MARHLNYRETDILKIFKRWIIGCRDACLIVRVTGRNHDHHPLAGAGEKNPVGVLEINLPLRLMDVIPAVPAERPMFPSIV